MQKYRIADGVNARIDSTADWCAEHMRRHLPALLDALRKPDANLQTLASSVSGTSLEAAFKAAADEASRWALPRETIFPRSPFPLRAHFGKHENAASFTLDKPATWKQFADLFAGPEGCPGPPDGGKASQLIERGFLEPAAEGPISRQNLRPGIYRLQHAAALVVGEEARILIDPVHFMVRNDPIRPEVIGQIDAIVLSHGHNDHVCPLSLVHYDRCTPILLYDSLGGSLLCPDIAKILRAAGFHDVRTPASGVSNRFGDIVVTARAFIGEQPWLLQSTPDPRLRAHGRTWLIETGGYRLWLLVDSGFEHHESMLDEAVRVRAEHGPVDIIASNLRKFPWSPGQIDGSGRYLFCFPLETLFNPGDWPKGLLMTLGPIGVGQLADIVGARCVLPHAHWFHQPGEPIFMDGATSEETALAEVRDAASSTLVTPAWQIGDSISVLSNGSIELIPTALSWSCPSSEHLALMAA